MTTNTAPRAAIIAASRGTSPDSDTLPSAADSEVRMLGEDVGSVSEFVIGLSVGAGVG